MILYSFAKINLSLHLLGKRADGYHEIETLMQTVDLADKITITECKKGTTVTCSDPTVPSNEHNLAYKAIDLVRSTYCITKPDIQVHIDKQIPVAAGLAGGSGNAAMTLHGLNKTWSLGLSKESLIALAAELGSDVPFCLYGGTALASGRGEQVRWLDEENPFHFVLINPPVAVSSAWAYQHAKIDLTNPVSCINLMVSLLHDGDFDGLISHLHNDLEPSVQSAFSVVREARDILVAVGASGVLMSGSGPTVFGVFLNRSEAQRAADQVRSRVAPQWRVFVASSISQRAISLRCSST